MAVELIALEPPPKMLVVIKARTGHVVLLDRAREGRLFVRSLDDADKFRGRFEAVDAPRMGRSWFDRVVCCESATSGQAATDPATPVMKSRRRIGFSTLEDPRCS
jgi:hypothetical protein